MISKHILGTIFLCSMMLIIASCSEEEAPTDPGGGDGTPEISGILPPGASPGIQITISGSNFGNEQGSGGVQVTDKAATIDSWSDTEIICTMPSGLSEGVGASATVTTGSGKSSSLQMDITPPNTYAVTLDRDMDNYPCWSPNGEWIYFSSTREGTNWDIYRIPAKGGVHERITYNDTPDFWPDMNPSSGELAWSSQMKHINNSEGDYEIFYGYPLCDGPGGACTIAMLTSNESRDIYPAYANTVYSGYSMVYTYEEVDEFGYYIAWKVMLHSNAGPIELTEGEQPNFSSDGQWVVYNHEENIYKIPTDGGSSMQLTDSSLDAYPHWGWANDKIVFQRRNGNNVEDIFVMNSDGTDVQPLVSTGSYEFNPTWSADCSKVVYHALVSGTYDIYVYVVP